MPKSYLISALKYKYICKILVQIKSKLLTLSQPSIIRRNALRRRGGGGKLSSGQWELFH